MVTRKKVEELLELNQESFENNEINEDQYQKNQAKIQTHVSIF
jgi:hypothetical protein